MHNNKCINYFVHFKSLSSRCAGYLFQRVGKIVATAVGGGFLLLQVWIIKMLASYVLAIFKGIGYSKTKVLGHPCRCVWRNLALHCVGCRQNESLLNFC